jgi:hypothetical protein
MRKLKHPIALFILAVLVVIAIGVGVGVSASGWKEPLSGPPVPSGVLREYGPPGYRFVTSFPGKARCRQDVWMVWNTVWIVDNSV